MMGREKSRFRVWGRVAALLVAGLCLGQAGGDEQKNTFSKNIPPFKEVFIKLFRTQLEVMSMDQLQTTSAQLTEPERVAMSRFLGKDGHDRVREGMPPEKQAFLDEKYAVAEASATAGDDFRKLFGHILAVANNNLDFEQMKETVKRLSAEDIASQSLYLGEEGRRQLFTEMKEDRVQVILDASEDWVFLETGKRKYETIQSYSCVLYKQELLGDELQGLETILVKYREKPKGIYMKWTDGPWKGRELIYNEALLGAGKVRVRESGILGIIPITLPVDSEIAKRGSNHEVTEIGLKYLVDLIEKNYRKAVAAGELQRKNHGIVPLEADRVYKMESILPKDKSKGYYCYRMYHYIDYKRSLEPKAEVYNHDDKLYESYYYTQLQLNPGLTDKDFDPANPDYKLK